MTADTTQKKFKIKKYRNGIPMEIAGTLDELIYYFTYTLMCGRSYQNEKGNKKINCDPKTAESLVTNLNNAESNRAANGHSGTTYELVG